MPRQATTHFETHMRFSIRLHVPRGDEFIATFDDYITALEAGANITDKYKVNQFLIKVDPALKSHVISLTSAADEGCEYEFVTTAPGRGPGPSTSGSTACASPSPRDLYDCRRFAAAIRANRSKLQTCSPRHSTGPCSKRCARVSWGEAQPYPKFQGTASAMAGSLEHSRLERCSLHKRC